MNVSIIIPIYNVEKYVVACLRSVAMQTMSDGVEVILVDDCGTDNSMPTIESFISNEYAQISPILAKNTKVLRHFCNKGLSAARNTGISVTSGKYIFFLDSDDELSEDCIEKMYELAETYNADMVQGCYIADTPMLTNFWLDMPTFSDDKGYIKRTMLDYDHFPIMAQNRLVRRDLILENKLYFKEGIIHEDNHWTFFLAKHIKRLAISSTPTYIYRTTPGSITSVKNIEKEAFASKSIIIDFCNNVDPIEEGAQKRLIFLNVLNMWKGRLYGTKSDAIALISEFQKINSFVERQFLWLCLHATFCKFFNNKCINLLQRLYLR